MLDMLAYYKMVNESNLSIIYSGPIWADGIEGIGGTLKKRLEFDELPLSASQSVFSVFVEQMSNMLIYSSEKELFHTSDNKSLDIPKGVFILGVQDKTYFIQSGNIMRNENIEFIKSRIDYLNTLDKAALRKFYREQIKNENENPDSNGAGLGLIEIARRVSSKIDYAFTPYDDVSTFFTMYVTIG